MCVSSKQATKIGSDIQRYGNDILFARYSLLGREKICSENVIRACSSMMMIMSARRVCVCASAHVFSSDFLFPLFSPVTRFEGFLQLRTNFFD